MPSPLSWTSIASSPWFLNRTSTEENISPKFQSRGSDVVPMLVAPASRLFSTNSLTTEHKSTMTWPDCIWWTYGELVWYWVKSWYECFTPSRPQWVLWWPFHFVGGFAQETRWRDFVSGSSSHETRDSLISSSFRPCTKTVYRGLGAYPILLYYCLGAYYSFHSAFVDFL